MSCQQPYSIFQGESKTTTLTVFKADGTVQNLTGWTLELEVKPRVGDPDDALVIGKYSPASGITILDQTVGVDTEGQAEIAFDPSDTSGKTPGQYSYDTVAIDTLGKRYYVVQPSPFTIIAVVNQA